MEAKVFHNIFYFKVYCTNCVLLLPVVLSPFIFFYREFDTIYNIFLKFYTQKYKSVKFPVKIS